MIIHVCDFEGPRCIGRPTYRLNLFGDWLYDASDPEGGFKDSVSPDLCAECMSTLIQRKEQTTKTMIELYRDQVKKNAVKRV